MPLDEKIYLGVGIKMPIKLVKGAPLLSYGKENIDQSIASILSTPIGSRFFLQEYGSRTDEVLFEPNDIVVENLLRTFIFEALRTWEKRAAFTDVTFDITEVTIKATIFYKILPSNEINSYVFPFYRSLIY